MPIKLLSPSEANTARPIACPGGGVRKITWEVPAITRADVRALAGPIDSRCLAAISSVLIFSAIDEAGEAQTRGSTAKAPRDLGHFRFLCSLFHLSFISP